MSTVSEDTAADALAVTKGNTAIRVRRLKQHSVAVSYNILNDSIFSKTIRKSIETHRFLDKPGICLTQVQVTCNVCTF